MSIISELKIARRRFAEAGVERSFYVIDDRNRATHTHELVQHLNAMALVTRIGGTPSPPITYAEVEAEIRARTLKMFGITICYPHEDAFAASNACDQPPQVKYVEPTPLAILALQSLVEANKRYVELTGRAQDAIALHPDHARELLAMLTEKCVDTQSA